MTAQGFAVFDTAIGPAGVAWGEHGLVGTALPEGTTEATRARLARSFPEAVEQPAPPAVRAVIDQITALLGGERVDLQQVELDLDGVPEFHQRVYQVARTIPPGEVLTYGDIARQLGDLTLARAVGQALGRNPFPIVVPCHRVLAAGGRSGGFSARGGVATKLKLLDIEGYQDGLFPL